MHICRCCGEEVKCFVSRRKSYYTPKYCSDGCRNKARRVYGRAQRAKPLISKKDMAKIKIKSCLFCGTDFRPDGLLKFCSDECRDLHKYGRDTGVARHHSNLFRSLRTEKVPDTDLIWNRNFYAQLVLDNECHYCGGPLPKKGHGLDRLDSSRPHTCDNVVPCCGSCNGMKGHMISYEEMMILRPGLIEIRKRREANPMGINYQQIGRPPVRRS